ncbi:MAG: citrate lyase holo-[acyl-carrier protein] synthase [Bacteroidales bacterium]|nr:citrate lyase holo-[acyl-carrier protein] synthase [Bacteroidales bacterium]
MITLEQLLESRDRRVERQRQLLEAFPAGTLLCLTVQLPGPEKRNATSLAIAKAGVEAIREAFLPEYEELRDLETGYEAYFVVSLPSQDAKRKACQIEDTHPLGRLMDIDVLVQRAEENYFSCGSPKNQFSSVISLSRVDIGLEPRKCLLCGNEVRYCMRARTHTVSELLERIGQMLEEYL